MSLSIRPTRYPVDPDTQADLFDQAIAAGQTGKQDTLVSGTNIKTVNGNSLLGSGNLSISTSTAWGGITGTLSSQTDLNSAINAKQDTLVSGTNIKSVNGTSLLGSGDITVAASGAPQIIAKKAGTIHVGTSTSGSALIAYSDISSYIENYMYLTISMIARKVSGGSSSSPLRLYVNSSASLTGATLLATFSPLTSATYMIHNIVGVCTNNSGYIYSATATSNYYAATSNTAIPIPSPCYLLWNSQTPNGDVMTILNSTVTKYV